MGLFEFVQWCFRDGNAGVTTIGVGAMVFWGVESLVRAFRGRS